MKHVLGVASLILMIAGSACGSDPYASDAPASSDFQLAVNQRGVSLVAHNANLKEVLRQISKKSSPFTILGDGDRLVTDSFENLPPQKAIERLLSRNYGLVTDQDGNSVVAVFIADDKPAVDSPVTSSDISVEPHREVDENHETIDPPVPEQPSSPVREIVYTEPLPISSSDSILNDLQSQGESPKQFIVSFGDYQSLYEIGEGETITETLEREKPNLLAMLDQQQAGTLAQPASEFTTRTIQMIEKGRSALLSGDVVLKSVGVFGGR